MATTRFTWHVKLGSATARELLDAVRDRGFQCLICDYGEPLGEIQTLVPDEVRPSFRRAMALLGFRPDDECPGD